MSEAGLTETAHASSDDGNPGTGYAHEHRPLRGYSALTATFVAAIGGSLIAARRSGRPLPERYDIRDLVLTGVATHKVSRLITKDKVTSYLRAPFVRYQDSAGQGEVIEEARGTGLRLAIGELLVCPYCVGQWVAAGFGVGYLAAPRLTRLAAFVFTAETISDFLQLGYRAAEERASS